MDLKKGISFFGVFSIASGAMISSGIFILPGLAFSKAGPAVFISYFIAGLLALLGIFSIIELSTAMPKAGGDYYYINKTFGPLLGTVSGFLGWFALSLKSAFAIFGISEMVYLFTGFSPLLSGLILCSLFIIINIVGVKEAAIFQVVMIIGLLSLMILYIIIGLPQVNMDNFSPFITAKSNKILITSGFIFISFGGLLKVANVSEEVINPKRNIPLGMIVSVVVVTILYTFITFVITGTLDPEVFSKSLTPVADSAKNIIGMPGYVVIIIASMLAFFTTANAGIMAASRYPMALSRDGLLPMKIASVSKRFKTPVLSTIITGVIIFLSLLLPLEVLVKAASTVILTSYVLTNFAVIIFRESKIVNYKPSFKSPFYPWLQILSILLFSFFILDLGREAIKLSLIFLFISFLIYMIYGRKVKNREYALIHLLKRITDNRLSGNNLENELRDILVNRDDIEFDGFDDLVSEAEFFDYDKVVEFDNLIKDVSETISKEIGLSEDEVYNLYTEREKDSSTAVTDFLAIPHIVIAGEDKRFLKVIRCREGLKYPGKESTIKAVFILGCTEDKRDFHLKSLASIASLINEKGFEDHWLQAKNSVALKSLMLLSNRKRYY